MLEHRGSAASTKCRCAAAPQRPHAQHSLAAHSPHKHAEDLLARQAVVKQAAPRQQLKGNQSQAPHVGRFVCHIVPLLQPRTDAAIATPYDGMADTCISLQQASASMHTKVAADDAKAQLSSGQLAQGENTQRLSQLLCAVLLPNATQLCASSAAMALI